MWQPIENTYTYHEIPQSKWIVIFVHWLTSDQNEEMFVQWEKVFNENWYSTIRFDLYWDLPWEKKLDEVCLQDNIDDVNNVIDFCKTKWHKKIFLVGHSYGWIANLYTNHDSISWILMRDPSIGWKQLLSDVHSDENWKHYIDWWNGYKYYISENLYQDFLIPSEKFLEKISEIKVPIKIIWAEKWLWKTAKKYYEYANEPKELTIISWANHRFLDWCINELLEESLKRIEKINNN